MLGFTVQPTWWNDVYGPAPYTKDNLILWEDLEAGKIAEPGKQIKFDKRFKRTNLSKHIPVDVDGNLLSPLQSGLASEYVESFARDSFEFGDHAPAETAWRRSSEYPFAIIKAWTLSQPAKVLGLGFDLARIKKSSANQWVYKDTLKSINLQDFKFSNVYGDDTRVFTSGFVNYIINYLVGNSDTTVDSYKEQVVNIQNTVSNCDIAIGTYIGIKTII